MSIALIFLKRWCVCVCVCVCVGVEGGGGGGGALPEDQYLAVPCACVRYCRPRGWCSSVSLAIFVCSQKSRPGLSRINVAKAAVENFFYFCALLRPSKIWLHLTILDLTYPKKGVYSLKQMTLRIDSRFGVTCSRR